MTKTFYVIGNDSGGVAILEVERYETTIKELRQLADQVDISKDGSANEELLRKRAEAIEKELEKLKAQAKTETFEITAFKRKDRIRAKKNATTWEGDSPKVDTDSYETNLIALATGKTIAEIEDLPDNLAQALYEVVLKTAYPTTEVLTAHRFLLPGSEEGKPSEE